MNWGSCVVAVARAVILLPVPDLDSSQPREIQMAVFMLFLSQKKEI
jgi:hypothetical protein